MICVVNNDNLNIVRCIATVKTVNILSHIYFKVNLNEDTWLENYIFEALN